MLSVAEQNTLNLAEHHWFFDERWHDLIVILDDATSEIYYSQLVRPSVLLPITMTSFAKRISDRGVTRLASTESRPEPTPFSQSCYHIDLNSRVTTNATC